MDTKMSSPQLAAQQQQQQRMSSPGGVSTRSPSSGGYPSNQDTSASHNEERKHPSPQQVHESVSGDGDRSAHGQQQQQRGGGRPTTSSLFDTTVLTSSGSTPSGDGFSGRAMAYLLDSIASSSSSPHSAKTPSHGGGTTTGSAATWHSPAKAGRASSRNSSNDHVQHHQQQGHNQEQHYQDQRQRERSVSGDKGTASARRGRRAHQVDVSEFTELLGGTPTWSRTPPRVQQKALQQQQQQQRHIPATNTNVRSFSSPHISLTPTHDTVQQHEYAYHRHRNDDSEMGSATPTNAEDLSSVLDVSSTYLKDDFQPSGPGMSSLSDHQHQCHKDNNTTGVSSGSSGNWASPAEMLQLRAMFQEVTARYQQEQTRLRTELTKAQGECEAYAREREQVQALQKAYTEGLAQCEKIKQQQAQWAEERALQQLQLEKMLVENQRLQLFIAKKQKLHRWTGHATDAVYVPTESQEKIRAAVQGVTTAAAAAAALNTAASSLSPFPTSYGPTNFVTGGTALSSAGRPITAPPVSSNTSQPHGMMADVSGNFHLIPANHEEVHQTRPAPGSAQGRGGEADLQGSPYTFVSSESTPPLQSSPPNVTPCQHQQQQQQRNLTLNSGSVVGTDHTQLPTRLTPITAATTSDAGATLGGSLSITDPSALYFSLSPAPLLPQGTPQRHQQHEIATQRSDNVVRAVRKRATTPTQTNARSEGREGADEGHNPCGSSSLATPSPTVSGVVTTPTSTTPSIGASQRDVRPPNGIHGSSSHSISISVGSNTHADARHDGALHLPFADTGRREVEGEEENENDDGTGGGTSTEFDPSYARGVTDTSSSSGSHQSNVSAAENVAALAMGRLVDAQTQQQPHEAEPQLPFLPQEEMSSSPPATSDSLGGGRLTSSTTRTGDTPNDELTGVAAPAATRTSVATVTTTTTATTATAPSLLPSTTTTVTNGHAGSTASSSTWSLQYLYHLPRTPAEALQEELRLLKEVRRLGEENEMLQARLHHLSALKAMDADQREQQLVRVAQESEQARSRAAQWELTASQLQSEVAALTARCAETADNLDRVLEQSKAQQQQAQARLVALEASSRAALSAVREETVMKMSELRCTWTDFLKEQQQQCQMEQNKLSGSDTEERERLQQLVETLRTELHTARAAQIEMQDRQHALETTSATRVTQLENMMVSTHDELNRATSAKHNADLHIDQLEAEVERLREAAVTREACMQATEDRLRIATMELASQQTQLEDASTWQARALGAEEELATQRAFYEKEINVYKTAACSIQERHHREMEKAVRRYEKLVVRFEAMKLRLNAVLTDCVCVNGDTWSSPTAQMGSKGAQRKSPVNTPENSLNTAAAKNQKLKQSQRKTQEKGKPEAFIVPIVDAAAFQRTARLSCDSVQALRKSVKATDRIVESLNRAASSLD